MQNTGTVNATAKNNEENAFMENIIAHLIIYYNFRSFLTEVLVSSVRIPNAILNSACCSIHEK